jgi:hypothetical protein
VLASEQHGAHLRATFAALNAETLRDMWASEARADWAEKLLREELLTRGVSALELNEIAGRRDEIARAKPPSTSDTLWKYGFAGRLIAFGSAVLVFLLVRLFLGVRAALLASTLVFGVYVVILIRRVSAQSRFNTSGWAMAVMLWQCIEAVAILAFFLFAALTIGPQR